MWLDLHCHSNCSDGSEPPEVVAKRAAARGVEVFCLTDHDTCEGFAATKASGCRTILRGLELSCRDGERTVHVLIYDIARDDARWELMEKRLEIMRQARKERLRAIAARLAELGVSIDVESIIKSAGDRTVGRPDIAQALVAAGAVSSFTEAFTRYLGDGGLADIPFDRISVAEGIDLGIRAGGKASIAHPHTLGRDAAERVARYREYGLSGLECYYGVYGERQRQRWLDVARKLDLVVTGGSDFHGAALQQVPSPGIYLPQRYAKELCDWLEV